MAFFTFLVQLLGRSMAMDQRILTYQKIPMENKLFIFHGTAPILKD
jgi:hypothetical protein